MPWFHRFTECRPVHCCHIVTLSQVSKCAWKCLEMLQIEHPFLQVFLLKQKSIISTSESRESIREFVTKNTDTDMAMTTSDIDTHIDGQCVSVSDVGSRTCFHMVVDRSTSCFHTDGHVMSTSSTSCIHVVNISYPHAHIMASVSSSVT